MPTTSNTTVTSMLYPRTSNSNDKKLLHKPKALLSDVEHGDGRRGSQDEETKGNATTRSTATHPELQRARPSELASEEGRADVAASALPEPIPYEGPVKAQASSPVPGGTVTATPTATLINPQYISNRKTSTIWIIASTTSSSLPTAATLASAASAASSHAPKHLPTMIIVLIAVGSTSFLVGAIILCKCLVFSRGHLSPPTPSAPILQETPLFGGKERFSQKLWAGPSYTNLVSSASYKAGIGMGIEKGGGWRPLSGGDKPGMNILNEEKFDMQTVSLAQNLPIRSPVSLYPASPVTNIGVALSFPPSDNGSTVTTPRRVKDNAKIDKMRRRQSAAYSVYGGIEIISPSLEVPDAFQTPRLAHRPGKPKATLKAPPRYPAGREPVKAPYLSYSVSQTSIGPARRQDEDEAYMYAIPVSKSEERRHRDTQALTTALGLVSPRAPVASAFSPVSIYPDDSLSVVDKHRHQSEMPSPSGTHAALGSLMLQDFPSVPTLASTKAVNTGYAGDRIKGPARDDRPPRVPSPPPLPSLAQMALGNADPDYRSPTYSIYGLYEAQRRRESKIGLGGYEASG